MSFPASAGGTFRRSLAWRGWLTRCVLGSTRNHDGCESLKGGCNEDHHSSCHQAEDQHGGHVLLQDEVDRLSKLR